MSYRYIGNKTRLLSSLLEEVKSIVPDGATVCDLMCGTASVAEALRVAGYKVIANDLMTFSAHHAKVRLLIDKSPSFSKLKFKNYFEVQSHLENLKPYKGLFFREYSPSGVPINAERPRMYFTSENAAKIDAINREISNWLLEGKINDLENSLLRHDLVLAANKVANIAGTYGHYRSKWSNGALAELKLNPSNFISGYSTNHIVLQGRAEDVSHKIYADLCYIDPPYMKRQYAANYHIIETLARGDEPEAVGVSGLRPWRDQYSNFCTKTKIRNSFRDIFSQMHCNNFLISYSEDGLLSKEEMTELFSEFGNVSFKEILLPRFKSNQGGQGGVLKEYLFTVSSQK